MTTLLVSELLQKYESSMSTVQRKLGQLDPLVRSGIKVFLQSIRLSEKVLFTPGTVDMVVEKMKRYDETIAEVERVLTSEEARDRIDSMFHRGTWIRFLKPFKIIDKRTGEVRSIVALLVFSASFYLPATGKNGYQMYLIDESPGIYELIASDRPGAPWEFDPVYHECPNCERFGTKFELCDTCEMILVTFSQIIALSAFIAAQYLAEEEYIQEKEVTHARVKREHSNKTRSITNTMSYKTIDANRLIITVPKGEEEARRTATGESWVHQAEQEGDLYREEIQTHPFFRVYRHARYTHMQGQKVDYPQGIKRMQPRRFSLDGKRVTKVKASQYGDE